MTTEPNRPSRKRALRPDQARWARERARWRGAYDTSERRRAALLGTIGRPFL
jgi:hypothetical protein